MTLTKTNFCVIWCDTEGIRFYIFIFRSRLCNLNMLFQVVIPQRFFRLKTPSQKRVMVRHGTSEEGQGIVCTEEDIGK